MHIAPRIYKTTLILLLSTGALLFVQRAEAATLANAKDTISTSRPSPSTPLSANAASGANQVSVFDNKSRFLASDSAKLIRKSSGALIDSSITIASQSAALTTTFFADTLGAAGQAGTDVLFSPITAMHAVSFRTINPVPVGGDIVIRFPGSANNTASPSATTFAFNNLGTSQVVANFSSGSSTCTMAVSAPTVICTVATAQVAAGVTVTILIGCTAQSGGSCTTQAPRLINPTKTATAGTADLWTVNLTTRDGSDVTIDSTSVRIGTIDSVLVQATVDPSLTFTIAGVSNGSAANTGNTTGCGNTETTNTGITPTATSVNLGVLGNTPTGTNTKIGNIAAQLLTITTNAQNGYSLTATSSGSLIDPANGYFLNSSTTPAVFPSGADWFGLHSCSRDASTSTWTSGSDNGCNTYITGSTGDLCKYGWPTRTTSVTLASDSTGPIGNSILAGNGLVTVEYAAGVDAAVPAGNYRSIVTYVATATF